VCPGFSSSGSFQGWLLLHAALLVVSDCGRGSPFLVPAPGGSSGLGGRDQARTCG
jgi:hypothetical protein